MWQPATRAVEKGRTALNIATCVALFFQRRAIDLVDQHRSVLKLLGVACGWLLEVEDHALI